MGHHNLIQATLKTHVSQLFTKVDANDRVQALIIVYEASMMDTSDTT